MLNNAVTFSGCSEASASCLIWGTTALNRSPIASNMEISNSACAGKKTLTAIPQATQKTATALGRTYSGEVCAGFTCFIT